MSSGTFYDSHRKGNFTGGWEDNPGDECEFFEVHSQSKSYSKWQAFKAKDFYLMAVTSAVMHNVIGLFKVSWNLDQE